MTTFQSRCLSGRLLTPLLAVVVAVGCSSGVKKVTVQGSISYKGQPLQSGILKFVGPEGATSGAMIQSDGTFTITDVVPGEVKVGVAEAPHGSRSSPDDGKAPGQKKPPVSLPEKYRDPETSGLKYSITPETKELVIDIK